MDDLDHSIHIAEDDWTSFCEESEECSLLQPSLACLDDENLTDSEDSGNLSSASNQHEQEPQQSPDADSDGAKSNAAEALEEESSAVCTKSLVLLNQLQDAATKHFEMCPDCPAPVTEQTSYSTTNTPQTEPLNKSTHLTKDEEAKPVSDLKSSEEPLSCYQTGLNVNEADTAERAVKEDVSRAEKERWFVTVNDGPARRRARPSSVKKKRRQKKTCERRSTQEKAPESGVKLEINEDKKESRGGRETKSSQIKKSGRNPNGEQTVKVGLPSDSSQVALICDEGDNLLSVKQNIPERVIKRSKSEPDSSALITRDTLRHPQMESGECDELGDSAEFLSVYSYDSESYLSAAESVEELWCSPQRSELYRSLSLTSDSPKTGADSTRHTQIHPSHSSFSVSVSAARCEVHEGTSAVPAQMFPSVSKKWTNMPGDNSPSKNDTHSSIPSDAPGAQRHKIHLSASGSSTEEQPSPLGVPDVIVTPCSGADCPETYAKAAGHPRPVYAISAFWDEMEKLTINDILQLRMSRCSPHREPGEAPTSNADDSPTNSSPLADTVEYDLSSSTATDTADTADSDYFTQPDESKPDRSSCEFSTSDFEEEFWQYAGASRNPSPDPRSQNKHSRNDSPFSSNEEPTSSEGRETPAPSEERCVDNQKSLTLTSSALALPSQLTKSKSMHNIHRFQTFAENTDCKLKNSLGAHNPAAFLYNTDFLDHQISFPEVLEYFFTEHKVNTDSWFVSLYDPKDISVAPVFDYALCSGRDDVFFSPFQCNEDQPIPIFSCSRPTIRDLTFPKADYVFLSVNRKEAVDISPVRAASHSFIQANQHGSTEPTAGPPSWRSFLSMRKICFHDKGSIWCRGSGAWVFPADLDRGVPLPSEGKVCPASSQLFRELEEQHLILETIQTTSKHELSEIRRHKCKNAA